MAIRERKGRASPWQVYWNNPFTGKRECANFATKEDALEADSLIKHRLKFDRESFKKNESDEEKVCGPLTLEAVYMMYLQEKQFSKKSLTWQLDSMRIPLRKMGQCAINEIGYEDLCVLMSGMSHNNIKPVTVRGRMSVLRTVLRWAAENGFCDAVRFPKLPPAKYEKFIPPSATEIMSMLEHAQPHIARVIILGAQSGARVGQSELLRLTWDNVDIENKILRIPGSRKNHDAQWREVPIRQSLASIMTAWRNSDMQEGIKHIIHYRGKPVSSIQTAWGSMLALAGINRRIRPYDLRHAFATELIAGGADIGTVARLMGHSSPSMILNHYQYVMDTQKRAAIETLPNIEYVPNHMCPTKKGVKQKA